MEETPFKRKAGAAGAGSQEREISIASVNLYQAMKTKENVYQAIKTEENVYQAMKTKEDAHRAIKTKEDEAKRRNQAEKRKNYFDHLAFMSRLTGK